MIDVNIDSKVEASLQPRWIHKELPGEDNVLYHGSMLSGDLMVPSGEVIGTAFLTKYKKERVDEVIPVIGKWITKVAGPLEIRAKEWDIEAEGSLFSMKGDYPLPLYASYESILQYEAEHKGLEIPEDILPQIFDPIAKILRDHYSYAWNILSLDSKLPLKTMPD